MRGSFSQMYSLQRWVMSRNTPPCGAASSQGDLGVVRQRHAVTRAELGGLRSNGAQDRASGEVAGVASSPPAVGAEEALVQPAVFCAREFAPPGGELEHGVRRLARHHLDQPRMSEEVALAQGIGEVLLPGILRIARPERRIDAAGREHGVCVQPCALPEHEHLNTRLCGSDGAVLAGGRRSSRRRRRGDAGRGEPGGSTAAPLRALVDRRILGTPIEAASLRARS